MHPRDTATRVTLPEGKVDTMKNRILRVAAETTPMSP